VVHQLQDERLDRWNPEDRAEGHRDGWVEALVELARAFALRQEDFDRFVDVVWGLGERVSVVGARWQPPSLQGTDG
jgi:hypothetical protein